MLMFKNFLVRQNERGLLFKKGDFQKFLDPGKHLYFDPLNQLNIEISDLSQPEFTHRLQEFLLVSQSNTMQQYFTLADLNATQVGLLYKNGHLVDILPPNTRSLYWRGIVEIKIELIDISEDFAIPKELARLLLHSKLEKRYCQVIQAIYNQEVPEHCTGLLYVEGQYVKTVEPGLHAYWNFNRKLRLDIVDLRLQEVEVSGQEILTKDKVSIRVNLSVNYAFQDVLKAYAALPKPIEHLYKTLQFGLRIAVGTRTLDGLLEDKHVIDEQIMEYIKPKAEVVGIAIKNVGIKDIILPGDMKMLLNKVVEADKVAQANIIKRREETAATRSLLNTAKVMEGNPVALRLKELETLEKLSENIDTLSVNNGLEGLLRELVKIR
ncbi:SPFH domain / Band 7 family protein [Achromatium sp. WMS3]|nr:SPFH domain / Band 7 family protein [Achromatium sp. WMS3]